MAPGQWQEVHQAPCLGAGGGERFRGGERFHLSGPRHRPAAIDLLRCSDRARRTRPASSRLVVAGNLRACRLSDPPISAGEAAGIPRGGEGLEESPLDSPAMTTAAANDRVVVSVPASPHRRANPAPRWPCQNRTHPLYDYSSHIQGFLFMRE